jgi:hypothetical protein
MSRLTRTLVLAAALAAMNLAGTTAVAQAQSNEEPAVKQDARRPPTERQVGESYRHREVASQEQTTADAALRRVLAREQSTTDAAVQAGLAQERYYSTWGYADTPTPVPDEPSGQPDWLVLGLGVLAAGLALSTGLAVLAARRAGRRVRAGQAA